MGKWSKLLICRCFKVRRPHSIGASCLSEGDLDRVLRSTDHTIMPASGEMERELKNVLSRVRSRKSGSAESVNIFSRIFEEKLNLLVRWNPDLTEPKQRHMYLKHLEPILTGDLKKRFTFHQCTVILLAMGCPICADLIKFLDE